MSKRELAAKIEQLELRLLRLEQELASAEAAKQKQVTYPPAGEYKPEWIYIPSVWTVPPTLPVQPWYTVSVGSSSAPPTQSQTY